MECNDLVIISTLLTFDIIVLITMIVISIREDEWLNTLLWGIMNGVLFGVVGILEFFKYIYNC